MKGVVISCLIGVVLGMRVDADPLIEGRVRLASGEPAAGAQVMLFDLTDLRKALAAATTDEAGYFELPLERVQIGTPTLPEQFELGQNYPNPFNPATVIPYQLPVSTHVRLDLFNMLGQRIATLVNGHQSAGFHTALWDGTDAEGRAVAAGVYLYRLQTDRSSLTRRMVLIDGQAGTPAAAASVTLSAVEEQAKELSTAEGSFEAATAVYGLTVSGRGLVTYVDPAFQIDPDRGSVDLVIEAADGRARSKVATSGLLGDVDNNGRVDIADALVVVTYIANNFIVIPNNGDISLGDVNGDTQIDYIDVWLILTYYVLPEIGAPVTPAKMYWTDAGTAKIQRADLDGTNVEDLIATGLAGPRGLALDMTAGKMYWIDSGTNPKKIQRADLDGTNVEDLVSTGLTNPLGLALDVAAEKMYWTDLGSDKLPAGPKIQRADLDGTNVEDLVTTGLSSPPGIALDVSAGKMYWVDRGTDKIQRADLDGSGVEDLVTTGLSTPQGIALDVSAGKMYWVDRGTGKIQRADLDGSGVEDLVTTGLTNPWGLALDVAAGKMLWTDFDTGKIQRADLDGSNIEDLVPTGLTNPLGIALYNPETGEAAPGVPSLSPDPSAVAFENDGTWHSFTVQTGEPVVVVANPTGTDSRVENTHISNSSNECPAEPEDNISRENGQVIYLAGCEAGEGTVQLRRVSDQVVLNTYTFTIEEAVPATPSTGASDLYWADAGTDKIQRSNSDGSGIEDLVTTGLDSLTGLALDVVEGKIYWADAGTDKIQRANLDGSNIQDLVTTGLELPTDLVLDVGEGKIYWADAGTDKIQRSNSDGSGIEDVVTAGLDSLTGLALDVVGSRIYWADAGTDKIQRANLDGSGMEDLVTTGLDAPRGLALDLVGGRIYWADAGTDKIQRANLDGSGTEDLVTTGLDAPTGLDLDVRNGKIYWTDQGANKIQRASLDGSNVEDLVIDSLTSPTGLALDISTALLSPVPSTVAITNDGSWHQFTVRSSEPIVMVANPFGAPHGWS